MCDEFSDYIPNSETKEYANNCVESYRKDIGKNYYYCTETFLSKKSVKKYIDKWGVGFWAFIIEMELSEKEFEEFINDDHEEHYARLVSVSDPIMFKIEDK